MNQRVVPFIIVAAALVAIAGFLLVSFLVSFDSTPPAAPDLPPDTTQCTPGTVIVGTESINICPDPNKQVVLVSQDLPPTETPGAPPPTATPDPNVPTATTEGGQPVPPATATPGAVQLPEVPARPDKVVLVPYQVRQGDTLYSVAVFHVRNNQPTSGVLMARFGIDATDLVPGTVINVPVANPAYCPAPYRPYVVLEGENAFRIAQKRGTTVDTLRQINGLDANYTVYVSDVICVP